jgi:hypothetical protein
MFEKSIVFARKNLKVHLLESELSLLNVEQFDKEFEWVQFKSQKPQKATANVSEMKNFKQQQLSFLFQIALTQHFFKLG